MDVNLFETEMQIKRHVFALGRLAGQEVSALRSLSKTLWLSSRNVSPQPKPTPPAPRAESSQPEYRPPVMPHQPQMPAGWANRTPYEFVTPPQRTNVGAQETTPDAIHVMSQTIAKEFAEAHKESTKYFADAMKELKGEKATDSFYKINDKSFYDTYPTIEDNDPDLDTYDLLFENMIATMSYGGRPPRKIDKLHMYRRGFRDGSVRKGVYEHEMRKAVLAQRDQNEPLEVLAEIQAKLREYLWETSMTRQSRLDAEFDRLQQGSIRHASSNLLGKSSCRR